MNVRRNAHDVTDLVLGQLANSMALTDMEISYHDDDIGSITLTDDDGTKFMLRVEMIHETPISWEIPNV